MLAQKGNRVRVINQSEIQEYLNLGYNIVDDSGRVTHEAIPTDVTSLRLAFVRHTDEIATLRAELESVNAKLAETTAQLNEATKKKAEPKTRRTKQNNDDTTVE